VREVRGRRVQKGEVSRQNWEEKDGCNRMSKTHPYEGPPKSVGENSVSEEENDSFRILILLWLGNCKNLRNKDLLTV